MIQSHRDLITGPPHPPRVPKHLPQREKMPRGLYWSMLIALVITTGLVAVALYLSVREHAQGKDFPSRCARSGGVVISQYCIRKDVVLHP